MHLFESCLRWYAVLVAVTWCLAPLSILIGGRLAGRGAALARPLALVVVVYPLWLGASLEILSYSTIGLWMTLLTGGSASWLILGWQRLVRREWLIALGTVELVGFLAFIAYIVLHGFTPGIWWSEQPMDMAFLASGTRTTTMPPPDPWLGGSSINYYYLGYVIYGAVTRMSGVAPTDGYNLALATTFSMAVSTIAGIAYGVLRRWMPRSIGIVGAIFAAFFLFAGNMWGPIQLVRHPSRTVSADWDHGIGWTSVRVIWDAGADPGGRPVSTINEFPFFSALISNLHPHFLALPFAIAAIGIALNFLLTGQRSLPESRDQPIHASLNRMGMFVLGGVMIGALYPMNSWDFPTYLALAVAAILLGFWRQSRRTTFFGIIGLIGIAGLSWLPFTLAFVPQVVHTAQIGLPVVQHLPIVRSITRIIGYVDWQRTSFREFLSIFAVPYFMAIATIGFDLKNRFDLTPIVGTLNMR